MTDVRKVLEAEREMEREFVAEVRKSEKQPKGWPAALILFHISMWRERLRNALSEVRDGRPYLPPPENIDEVNDAEVASGLGVSLADISERSDTLLASLIALFEQMGDRPFKWYIANTTTEALLRKAIPPRAITSSNTSARMATRQARRDWWRTPRQICATYRPLPSRL